MAMVEINWKPDKHQLRGYGWIGLVAFGLLGAWVWWKHALFVQMQPQTAQTVAKVLWAVAGAHGLLALVAPVALKPVYLGLMLVTMPIGFVVSHVVIFLTFFGIFLPVGLIMRLFGYDPMHRSFDRAARTYWIPREPVTDVKRYFRQF